MNKTVLVIDDSSVLRDIMREVLEDAGFNVIEAPHGQLGLERAQELAPDIVLCDINMPVLDGYGFVQAARAHEQLITAYIGAMMRRYRGRMHSVDVVNEAILEDGSAMRPSLRLARVSAFSSLS